MKLYSCILLSSILFLSLLTSCNDASMDYVYIDINEENVDKIEFKIDVKKTDAPYKLFFACRFSKEYHNLVLPIELLITKPSGELFVDAIPFPTDIMGIKMYIKNKKDGNMGFYERIKLYESANYYDIQWLYRDNIRLDQEGIWTIAVRLPQNVVSQVAGIGMHYEISDLTQ